MNLDISTVPGFYQHYVRLVEETDLLYALRAAGQAAQMLLREVPESRAGFRYAEGKWSIQEVLCHLLDSERIFGYRALRFARNDPTPLPGFEQDDYVPQSNASSRSLQHLADEMARLRTCTIDLFEGFSPEMLLRRGEANRKEVSVLALGYIIAGHERHHLGILRDRYLAA